MNYQPTLSIEIASRIAGALFDRTSISNRSTSLLYASLQLIAHFRSRRTPLFPRISLSVVRSSDMSFSVCMTLPIPLSVS